MTRTALLRGTGACGNRPFEEAAQVRGGGLEPGIGQLTGGLPQRGAFDRPALHSDVFPRRDGEHLLDRRERRRNI